MFEKGVPILELVIISEMLTTGAGGIKAEK